MIKVSSTSVNFTITGYASTKYAPGVPPSFKRPKRCCRKLIPTPNTKPMTIPEKEINHPSNRKMRAIVSLGAPMLFKILISFFFSIIRMDNGPTTLKAAIIRINERIKNKEIIRIVKDISFGNKYFNWIFKSRANP